MKVKGKNKQGGAKPLDFNRLMRQYMASTFMTPRQIRKEARRETNLAIKDSMRQLRYQSGRAYEQAKREQNAANVMGQILASYRSGDAAAMQGAYSTAAQQVSMMNQGLLDPTIAAQKANAAGAQADATRLAGWAPGAPIPTMGDPSANALVARQLGISIPSELLSTIGAAEYEHGMAGGSAQASKFGQMATQELDQRLRDIRSEYAASTREILAKRPGMMQEALANLRESARGDFSTLINAAYLQNTLGKTEAELTGVYKGKPTQAAIEAANQAAVDAAAAAATAERIAISRMNAKTSRMRAITARDNAKIEAAAARAEQAGENVEKNVEVGQDFRDAARKWVTEILSIDKKKGRPAAMPPSKQTLINGIFRLYARPLVGKYGLTQETLALWAAQVVNAFPPRYWDPKTYKGATTTGGKGGKAPSAADILAGED